LSLSQAKTKQTRAINAKIVILLLEPVIAYLKPAAMHRTPVAIQIISRIRRELFLILQCYISGNLKNLPVKQMRILFKSDTLYYLILTGYLDEPVGINMIFFLIPEQQFGFKLFVLLIYHNNTVAKLP